MSTVNVDIINIGKVFSKYSKKLPDELREAVVNGILMSMKDIVESSPKDTGQYANSWDIDVQDKKVVVGNFAPHAAIIEFGARPFTPPLGPLLAWAKRVLQDPSQPPDYSDSVWALALYTRNKIKKFGMAPRAIMRDNIPIILDNIKNQLEALK